MAVTGRPPFKATPALRRKVEELTMCGMSQEVVARAIGCSHPTLVKHFPDELTFGLAKKRAEVIAMLFKSAKGGNVTAQKKLEEMSRLAGAEAEFDGRSHPAPQVGKKVQAEEDAKSAGSGTGWGDDLSPAPARLQ